MFKCAFSLMLSFLSLITLLQCSLIVAEDKCGGPLIQLNVRSNSANNTYYGIISELGNIQFSPIPSPLLLAKPLDACDPLQDTVPGAMLLAQRGNCTFTEKVLRAAASQASALLVFDNEPGCINMGFDVANLTAHNVSMHAISIRQDTGVQLMAALANTKLTAEFALVTGISYDPAEIVLWLMAVGTLVFGSIWSGWEYMAEKEKKVAERVSHSASGGGLPTTEVLSLDMRMAALFVFVASALLLLLFFFLNKAFFYILLVIFSFAAIQAYTMLFASLLSYMLPAQSSHMTNVPTIGPVQTLSLWAVLPSAALVLVWMFTRNSSWSWILQDTSGIAVMVLILRLLRVDSLRTACVLLPACFAYDIFWVFLQPAITGGPSVMVEVAQGGSSNEFLPMLLRVPHFMYSSWGGESMLGYGDVILPGLLAALTRRMDLDSRASTWGGYFWPCVCGYAFGLVLTFVALICEWGGDQGQPALLYLVPCTLGLVLVLAAARRQLRPLLSARPSGSVTTLYSRLETGGDDEEANGVWTGRRGNE